MQKQQVVLCHCGHPDDSHNFRHMFDPQIFVDVEVDEKGEIYHLDATDFKAVKIEGKCKFPQCGAVKNLHGPIIKHDFDPDVSYFLRNIRFKIPLSTKCRYVEKTIAEDSDELVESVCSQPLETHESTTHAFTTKVVVNDKGEHDNVKIIGKKPEQTIVWED